MIINKIGKVTKEISEGICNAAVDAPENIAKNIRKKVNFQLLFELNKFVIIY